MNLESLLNVVKNHELVIMEPNQVRQLLGVKRLDNDAINELSKELGLLGFVLIPIRYNSSSNGLTNVRKVVIVKKNTYLKIVREKDRNAIARAVIDYVFSNKQLFTANIKGDGNMLKIQTSLIRKLLRYIGLDNHYIDTRMGSIVLTIRTLLEVSGFTTELKRAMGRMNSIIYAYDGNPWVTEAGERLKNPPAKSEAGEKHDGNPTWSNPSKVHTGEKESANHEELKVAGAGPDGAVGTTAGVRGSVGREGGRHSNAEVQNSEGGREGTTATQGGGD